MELQFYPFPNPSFAPPAYFRAPAAATFCPQSSNHHPAMPFPLVPQPTWPLFSARDAGPRGPAGTGPAVGPNRLYTRAAPAMPTMKQGLANVRSATTAARSLVGARRTLQFPSPEAIAGATPAHVAPVRSTCAPGARAVPNTLYWQSGGKAAALRAQNPNLRTTYSVNNSSNTLLPKATAAPAVTESGSGGLLGAQSLNGCRVSGPKRSAANARERVRMRVLSKAFAVSQILKLNN